MSEPPEIQDSLNVLVIFANPPERPTLGLEREAKAILNRARQLDHVSVEPLHAAEIDDITDLIVDGHFDVIQFSGHGDPGGIVLDKSDLQDQGDLVSPERLRELLSLPHKQPDVILLLACFSNEALEELSDVAPFVITALGRVSDEACAAFVGSFYERLFSGSGIQSAFDQTIQLLRVNKLPSQQFRLDRRALIREGGSVFAHITPDPPRDAILINLDEVMPSVSKLGLTESRLCHLLNRKLIFHEWIFGVPRERCVIPIGNMLCGVFSWENAKDVVYCHELLKLSTDIPVEHWKLWTEMLWSYNDLASSRYRTLRTPASPRSRGHLQRAVSILRHNIDKYLKTSYTQLEELGFKSLLPYAVNVETYCQLAEDQIPLERYQKIVQALELALTNFHELVEGLQPPPEGSESLL